MKGDERGDMVNHPPHYTMGKIEVINMLDEIALGYPGSEAYSAGCVVKYVARAPYKGALLEDLRKAQWYLTHLIELVEGKKS